ncbi:MAG: type I-E CRISPR-associated protein Cse2/CasB [Armatimonadetes bacterium]|nr:type I-E CRISPR-associated protein Cse2/CasB [Armatimonadota bacterium]
MTPTEQYIRILTDLKPGELGLLRTHPGQDLDRTVDGFDLFTGLWWPLRQKNERAPRREVAWLIAKLYAYCPIPQSDDPIACQLRRCQPTQSLEQRRFMQRVDGMLILPLDQIEPALRWALNLLDSKNLGVDWVKLTDDLSAWEREPTRLRWAEQYLRLRRRQC